MQISLDQLARLAGKELREILRDRRTIVTLVLMPVLVYPLLGMAFRYFLLTTGKPTADTTYRIATRSEVQETRLVNLLGPPTPGTPKLLSLNTEDLEGALLNGDADVAVVVDGAEREFEELNLKQQYKVHIFRLEESVIGIKAEEYISDRLKAINVELLRIRLRAAAGGREPVEPVSTEVRLVSAIEGKKPTYVASLIPLVLVLMTITGGVYPAIDLTAGERERGTLEILMAAPIPRVALLLAKYVAVMAVTMFTGIVNLTMMTLTLLATGLGAEVFGGLTFFTLLAVLVLLLLFAAFFSAILLAVTSFARSFKEAQSYLIPLMLLSISPGLVALMPGVKLGGVMTIVPLLNVVLLSRELLGGGVPIGDALIVVASTLLYAFAAITVASKLFGAEAVLYSEQAHWSDLFRRPLETKTVAPVGAALICLALLFPLTFLLNGLIGIARGLTVEAQMILLAASFVALFIGLPLLSAYQSRVDFRSGFQLHPPPLLALGGALLLSLTLWPFIVEMFLIQEKIGFSSMPDEVRKAMAEGTYKWQQSPWFVLFAMAIIPGLVEEFFFRGYLYNSLEEASAPPLAIFVTALVFGVFHIFPGGILAIERLFPSMAMGVVLGYVRWCAGSVWPGVLLHVLYNGLLLSAALFPSSFGSLRATNIEHIPMTHLAIAGAGVLGGLLLVSLEKIR